MGTDDELIVRYTCTFGQKLEIDNSIKLPLYAFCIKRHYSLKNEPQISFARFNSLKHFAASAQRKFGSVFFGSSFADSPPRSTVSKSFLYYYCYCHCRRMISAAHLTRARASSANTNSTLMR